MRRRAGGRPAQRGGGRQPAGVAPHALQHDDRIVAAHGGEVQGRLLGRDGPETGRAAVPRAVVRLREVVVNGFRHADDGQIVADVLRRLTELETRLHRVVAANVGKGVDVVAPEPLDDGRAVVGIELAAAGAERRARCGG